MKAKEKAKNILDYSVKMHGPEKGMEEAIKSAEQIAILSPMENRNYWKEVQKQLENLKNYG
jgi:hypothetical protein